MEFDILKGKDTGMNGFKIMADSYRKAASDGFTNPEVYERKARVFDILAECDQEELYTFIDSSAFNDIIRDFMRLSLKGAGIDEEDSQRVMNELRLIFSEKSAKEVCEIV